MSHVDETAGSNRITALSKLSEASARSNTERKYRRLFPLLLLCVFFIALLLALIAGVTVYRHVSDVQAANVSHREGIELICNIVRANDAKGAVAVGDGPEGKSLVIVQNLDSGTYETRLYLYKGSIVQEYSLAGTEYTPSKASKITDSSSFAFTYDNGLLTVTTDQGTCEVALRYLQGGE